jgi:hypothetical protein
LTGISAKEALMVKWRELLIPILKIHQSPCPYLFKVGKAIRLPRFLPCSAENWEENSRQNGKDGYDDEQFNERKSLLFSSFSPPFFLVFAPNLAGGESTGHRPSPLPRDHQITISSFPTNCFSAQFSQN